MGTLFIQYCDVCERSTPLLPSGHWPEGWFKLFFADEGERMICSYQCLFEFAKKALDNPPAAQTQLWPQDDPCPPLAWMPLDRVPERLRYTPTAAQLARKKRDEGVADHHH